VINYATFIRVSVNLPVVHSLLLQLSGKNRGICITRSNVAAYKTTQHISRYSEFRLISGKQIRTRSVFLRRFSREVNSIYAHFLTLVWFLWMKFVSFGIVLIALLLSMYVLLSISETRQKPIHLQCRTKMEKPFCSNTPMFRVICRCKRKFYTSNYSI